MNRPRKALIVGAGIGGPVLAMWLQRIGIDAVLLEARPDPTRSEGAFLGVAPNGMTSLAGLGLAERVLARGHACTGFTFRNAGGAVIGTIDRGQDRERFGWPLTMIRRSDLHTVLGEACAERGVAVRVGQPLEGLEDRGTDVRARFGGGQELVVDFVVGCDVLRSTTRLLAIPEAPAPTFSGLLDFGGFVRSSQVSLPRGSNEMVFGKRAFFGAFRTPEDEIWWFHNGPPSDAPLDLDAHRARLLELHRGDPPWVRALVATTPTLLGPWRIHDLLAMPRWSRGRVCLLGDAAHAMSPSAGQGAALAMEDAQALAQCLRDHPDPTAAFARYERLRRPRVDAMFAAARRNGSGKAPSAVGAWFRDRMLPLFLRAAQRTQSESYAYRLEWSEALG